MQGRHPEGKKKRTFKFSLWSNCGYFGTKCKVRRQVEEELWFFIFYFFLTIFKLDEWHFKFDVKYLEE